MKIVLVACSLALGTANFVALNSNAETSELSSNNNVVQSKDGQQSYPYRAEYPQHTEWRRSNVGKREEARELNDDLHLVGLTSKDVFSVFGHPVVLNGSSFYRTLGPYKESSLEVKYEENSDKVRKFRFVEKINTSFKVGAYSTWQAKASTKSRAVPQSEKVPTDYTQLTAISAPFDEKTWQENKTRWLMVWSLLHEFKIIGMTEDQVHKLLGAPSLRRSNVEGLSEFYALGKNRPAIIPLGPPASCLELSFSNGCVSGVRISMRGDVPS
ncbi:MAG: hypothetical protein P4L53_05860 [Candidatus Obscuribacterales bacterium]|nr:hypothetical protein [Candidatus Obscuribacterales bacterium]